jgi:hypothetical protein
MELNQKRPQKKKDKKPLYILAGFLLFFGVFIYLITRPSTQSKAIDQIQICSNVSDVKSLYDRYKFDLLENDKNGSEIVSLQFQNAIRNKLQSLNLDDNEIKECIDWLPPAPTSINLIVIPDLSRRITDTLNNPNQISNDIFILQTIWKSFVEYSKLKQDTKDKLIIDVTDIDQAKGLFGNVANNLQFDLSAHKGKSNRLYFTTYKDKQFKSSITEMYKLANAKPLGADYKFYFRRYLKNHLKKPTLFDNYINKVVIITDGYLEAEGKPADTKIHGFEKSLHQSVITGNTLDVITLKGLNIPKMDIDLSNSEILVCEVNERHFIPFTHKPSNGLNYDFEILNTYWEDWFKRMKAKKENIHFLQRELANDITAKKVTDFILK